MNGNADAQTAKTPVFYELTLVEKNERNKRVHALKRESLVQYQKTNKLVFSVAWNVVYARAVECISTFSSPLFKSLRRGYQGIIRQSCQSKQHICEQHFLFSM